MAELSKHEQAIWEDTIRLHMKYTGHDLAHDAHEIWLLAGDACRELILKHNICPCAVSMAKGIVNYYIQLYRMAETSVTNPM